MSRTTSPPSAAPRALSRRPVVWLTGAFLVFIAVLIVLVSRQGGGTGDAASSAQAGDTSQATTEQIQLSRQGGSEVGDQAPGFTARTTANTSFELPGGKPSVLFFMAGWCSSCVPEAQALERIREDYGDEVNILGVDADPRDTLDVVRQFADGAGATYGFVRDGDGSLVKALNVRVLDTTVITDAQGRIVFRDAVPTDEETLRSALDKAGVS